ncbi:hypothetical protein Tco_0719704 [Tanacetum coccineum]
MAVRVPLAMSSGLSASMEEVATMSEFAFRKRFRSSRESSPSLSPLDLPSRKRYRGTSEFVEDSEEDDDEEDEEIEESLDSDSVSEDAEDEGPTAEDEDPAAGDESLAARDEGPSMDDESHGIDDENHDLDDEGHSIESDRFGLEEEEEAGSGSTPEYERPERVSASRQPTLTTWTDPEDGMVFIDVPAYPQPEPPVQTQPLPEWTSGLLHISLSPSVVPSPISSPMIPLTVPSLVAIPTTTETEGFLTELGAQRYDRDIGELFTRSRAVRDEIFSQRYRFRSLEYEQERVAMTFGAIWRPVLALKLWAGQMDAQRAALWHAISDMQGENYDLRLQLAEERRARLELTEVVDSMRKGQEPRGDVQPTLTTWIDLKDGMVYIDVPAYPPPAPPVMPATTESKGFLTEDGAQVENAGGRLYSRSCKYDCRASPALFERSLEYEQEWVVVTFGAIWRLVLALESWTGQTDAHREQLYGMPLVVYARIENRILR